MDDETFSRIVADNVKNKSTAAQNKFLELPENNQKLQEALSVLIRNIDEQIAQLSLDAKADSIRYAELGKVGDSLLTQAVVHYEVKKQKIERFKFYVMRKLSDAIAAGANNDKQDDSNMLIRAIKKHREMNNRFKIDSTPLDLALYDSMDGVWSFDSIKAADLADFSDYASTI